LRKAFRRRRGDSGAEWAARRFCARACSWASMRSLSEAKVCEECGSPFERAAGRHTDAGWEARRYCGRPCAFAARRAGKEARFWARVDQRGPDECWPWIGRTQGETKGEPSTRGRFTAHEYAYRLAYEFAVGPLEDGVHVHHICENPNCVNPAHLEPLTPAEHIDLHKAGVPRPQSVREAISRGHRASQRSKAAAAARRGVPRSLEVRQKISSTKRERSLA